MFEALQKNQPNFVALKMGLGFKGEGIACVFPDNVLGPILRDRHDKLIGKAKRGKLH